MHGGDYPFGAPATAGLLRGDGTWVAGDDPGRAWPGRTPVVAVGSNAVPMVVHAKLAGAGVAADVPFARCDVRGLGTAHSAHVSAGGYLARTPFAAPEQLAQLVVSWFTAEQLAAVDATEPNYRRVRLPGSCQVPRAQVYVSRWGVLAPGGTPLAPVSQAEVHRVLARDARLAALLPLDDARATVSALRRPGTAVQVRRRFEELGWVRPTGLA